MTFGEAFPNSDAFDGIYVLDVYDENGDAVDPEDDIYDCEITEVTRHSGWVTVTIKRNKDA